MGTQPSSPARASNTETGTSVKASTSTRGLSIPQQNDVTSTQKKVMIDDRENGVEMIATSDEDSNEYLDARDSEETDSEEYDSDSDDEDDEDEDEEDGLDTELFLEKASIFEDAHRLKFFAVAVMHPEKPVAVGPYAQARCFFERPSAPGVWTLEQSDEMAKILEDTEVLKKQARKFLHPEDKVVTTDPTATGRNFFDRPSALDTETKEDADERAQIMEDALKLKQFARSYLHPEDSVETTDPTCYGRSFFERPSAPVVETKLEDDERSQVLADAAKFRKLARDFLHPEDGIAVCDSTCSARNFFARPSAPEVETFEEAEEKAQILADASSLRKLARNYLHPEDGVASSDPMSFGRCYFDRPSGPEVNTYDEAEERAQILADAGKLKKLAREHLHPEDEVGQADPALFARNYFDRPSAPEVESIEEAQEREQILKDAANLKRLARDFLHPEDEVATIDATCFGRNYFERPSAVAVETMEELEERNRVFADANQLRRLARRFQHPEDPVVLEDVTLFGRNYFERSSAPKQESMEEAKARAEIEADAAKLKKLARDYLHPEEAVATSDPSMFGRNYFERPSAPKQESKEESEARAEILADAAKLRKLARDYMHPENGVEGTDGTLFGRNYFDRPSAPGQETFDEAETRCQVLADMANLRVSARGYLHPEDRVTTTDGAVFGRNYFDRPSAPEVETMEEAEEKARVLEDAIKLKKLARDHLHPEDPVSTIDYTVFARNYFERPSAPEMETLEESTERAEILADANKLEKLARDYLHPEERVSTSDPTSFGRNYFNRPSAPSAATVDEAEVQAQIMADAAALKTKATDHMHPEVSVKTSDPNVCGRNFFDRVSSPDENIATYPADDGYFVEDEQEHHVDYHGTHDTDLHFDLDEDELQLEELRKSIQSSFKVPSFQDYHDEDHSDHEGEGTKKDGENLSRSPSSVMLFGMDQQTQQQQQSSPAY